VFHYSSIINTRTTLHIAITGFVVMHEVCNNDIRPARCESAERMPQDREGKRENVPLMLFVDTLKGGRSLPLTTPSKAVSGNENLLTPLPVMVSRPPEDAVAVAVAWMWTHRQTASTFSF
jgi:hypothetical protein